MNNHADYFRILLEEIEAGNGRSQRSLAKQLGIALGLTNLLLRQIIRRGWIRMVQIKPNRVVYLITPAGLAEKAQMSRDYLVYSARFYVSARDRLLEAFGALSEAWPTQDTPCRVAFYGAGEIAEIGYVCLHSTDLTLVGVVDETRGTPFFGLPVRRPHDLAKNQLAGVPFDRLVVMVLDNLADVERTLEVAAVPREAVFWLRDWRWANPVGTGRNAGGGVPFDRPNAVKSIGRDSRGTRTTRTARSSAR